MNLFSANCCPTCHSENIHPHTSYFTYRGEQCFIYHCQDCQDYFSEAKGTPLGWFAHPVEQD